MDELDLGATIRGFSAGQKIFGRYTLKRLLGRGGMGVVWLARDESLERDIAIKMLPEMVASDPAAVRELKRETSRSQQLSHPHILRIYDFAEGAGLCGITMELVEGGTLTARRLDEPGEVFTVGHLESWVRQLCEALAYAHEKVKIVHRDLKPANLMLTPDGDLKVADFGIAASVSDSVSRASRQAGSSGTPVYMSPQQMMGDKPAVTDDIYSLGATLYELLTGRPPFYSGNVMMQVQNKVPPTIAERRKELEISSAPVPAEWEQTIAACLVKEPNDRPQSASEVAEQLGLGGMATKSTKTENRGQRTGDGKAGRLVPAAPSTVQPAPAPQAKIENKKSKTGLYAGIAAGVLLLAGLGYYFGVYAPEQKRLAEIKRLESEGRAVEAARLRTEKEKQDNLAREQAVRLVNARGGIILHTTPANAEIQIGGFALEHGPAVTLKDIRLGKYPVLATAPDCEEWRGEVVVEENKFANLEVKLARSTGTIELGSDPAGAAFVLLQTGREGVKREGVTPAKLDGLPTGAYTVEFSRKGLKKQTASGDVARGGTLRLSASLPPAKLDDTGYVTQQVLEITGRVPDAEVQTGLLGNLNYALEREGGTTRVEMQRLLATRVQVARKITDPFNRANSLRSMTSYLNRFDPDLVRPVLLEAAAAAKQIDDPKRRIDMTGYIVDEARLVPDLGAKLLEEYRALLPNEINTYENYTLPQYYAQIGLDTQGQALVDRYGTDSYRKNAEEAFARGRTIKLGDQALALGQKGDKTGAKAIIAGLPEEIDTSPCINLIYGFGRLGEPELAKMAADHAPKEYRAKRALNWLANAILLYDRPDLAAESARKNEDGSMREESWREIAGYYGNHGLLREARSAAAEIPGAGTSYVGVRIWIRLGDRDKARQAAALSPELAGTKEPKGNTSLAEYFVLLGDGTGFDKLETSIATETLENRAYFYHAAATGYALLQRWSEAVSMINKIPLAKLRASAGQTVGQRAGAFMGVDNFTDWVERLPDGEVKAGALIGWIFAQTEKRNLTRLGYQVIQ